MAFPIWIHFKHDRIWWYFNLELYDFDHHRVDLMLGFLAKFLNLCLFPRDFIFDQINDNGFVGWRYEFRETQVEPLLDIEIDFLFMKVFFEVWDRNFRIRRNDAFENLAFFNDGRLLVGEIGRRIVEDCEGLWGQ